jgi:hypothetical protein
MQRDEIERLLHNWAWWYARIGDVNAGYPSINIIAKFRSDGGIILSGTGRKPEPTNEDAEMVEKFWIELYHKKQRIAVALKRKYFKRMYESDKYIAKELGVTERMFQYRIDEARKWIQTRYEVEKRKAA